ncbi:hypothetical protein HS088_TW16G00568 [Tripterygium wilfordii]|uniref:RING-type domain-containing protein n=1 Tax=Tripterygium wilfordii TaxID=458696 RepID=A0A7J7CJF0_TRIWF|nr:uncharacterized protein LOC119981043 [Tripterygium wilfordii]XP_038679928.1 uncharacterized protein LOC119981043 [Tripterygium wilfordii]KAF5734126.1 hypothetical protein HS088_TW16G00568 [Tripterygium wilfordii]
MRIMWAFASGATCKTTSIKNDLLRPNPSSSECADDDISVNNSREEGLECPICWESFNIVENVPYVLWCGHTMCKNCILGLQRALVRLPTLPIQLPFFISCPWCNLLSLRLVYKGNIRFPSKNFFLFWMLESMNGDRSKSCHSCHGNKQSVSSSSRSLAKENKSSHVNNGREPCTHPVHRTESLHNVCLRIISFFNIFSLRLSFCKSLIFFIRLMAKVPLIIFLLIILYAIPASVVVLALYIIITLIFTIPSFLVLYFAISSLNWLVRESHLSEFPIVYIPCLINLGGLELDPSLHGNHGNPHLVQFDNVELHGPNK